MSNLRYRTRIEFGVTAVVILFGGFFTILALRIPADSEELVGPRTLPMFIGITMIVLGVLISIIALRNNGPAATAPADGESDGIEIPPEDDFGFRDSDIKRVFEVIGCGIIYIILFYAFGYFMATLISMALILLAFGNRKIGTILMTPVIGAVIYQYVFMGLMGLHDPAGSIADLTSAFGWISGN